MVIKFIYVQRGFINNIFSLPADKLDEGVMNVRLMRIKIIAYSHFL